LIPSLSLAIAAAQEPAEEPPAAPDDVLSPYRLGFDDLVERAIGTTSVPVAFDWRRTSVQVGGIGSYLVELNNFNGMRGGALVRLPTSGAVVELGATYAASWESPSSRQLALTPYRQSGHPDRLELDFAVGLPLAEGVVTTTPRFFPAMEMVFNFYAGFRYIVYPTGFAHMTPGQVLTSIISPTLSATEITNLEPARLPAMEIDQGRYGVLLGLGDDLYFESGFFLSPRWMLAIPLLEPVSHTELLVWTDLSLAVGLAF
jgi:hypothetical protein